MEPEKDLKSAVLKEYENGNILIASHEGIMSTNLKEFIEQPADGILYDLNRSEAVVLTFIDDPKWINDFAVCKTIRALKIRIDELEKK